MTFAWHMALLAGLLAVYRAGYVGLRASSGGLPRYAARRCGSPSGGDAKTYNQAAGAVPLQSTVQRRPATRRSVSPAVEGTTECQTPQAVQYYSSKRIASSRAG